MEVPPNQSALLAVKHQNEKEEFPTLSDSKPVSIRCMDLSSPSPAEIQGLKDLIYQLQEHESALFDRMIPAAELDLDSYIHGLKESCREHEGHILLAVSEDPSLTPKTSRNAVQQEGQQGDINSLGYAVVLTRVPSNPEEDYEVQYVYASVTDIVVRRDYQRRGIGKALLTACEQKAREVGTQYLRIEVLSKNTGAHRSYLNFGFQEHLRIMEKAL